MGTKRFYRIEHGKMIFGACGVILSLLLLFTIFLTAGCSNVSSYQKSIYNDNKKISVMGDSYSFFSRSGNFINNKLTISFKGFSGKQTIWKLSAKEDCDLIIDCNNEIYSGKFKLCLVNEKKEVSTIAEGNKTERLTIDIKKGVNYVAIVGNKANGKLNLTLTKNEKISVTQRNN